MWVFVLLVLLRWISDSTPNSQQFDFAVWDEWARTASPNPDVKIFIGAPGSATAAGQGFVDIGRLQQYAMNAQATYDTFGGVMLWDASDAYGSFSSAFSSR